MMRTDDAGWRVAVGWVGPVASGAAGGVVRGGGGRAIGDRGLQLLRMPGTMPGTRVGVSKNNRKCKVPLNKISDRRSDLLFNLQLSACAGCGFHTEGTPLVPSANMAASALTWQETWQRPDLHGSPAGCKCGVGQRDAPFNRSCHGHLIVHTCLL